MMTDAEHYQFMCTLEGRWQPKAFVGTETYARGDSAPDRIGTDGDDALRAEWDAARSAFDTDHR